MCFIYAPGVPYLLALHALFVLLKNFLRMDLQSIKKFSLSKDCYVGQKKAWNFLIGDIF